MSISHTAHIQQARSLSASSLKARSIDFNSAVRIFPLNTVTARSPLQPYPQDPRPRVALPSFPRIPGLATIDLRHYPSCPYSNLPFPGFAPSPPAPPRTSSRPSPRLLGDRAPPKFSTRLVLSACSFT
ncbi:hypothetical protein SLA2020_350800 [Shorea laevis]